MIAPKLTGCSSSSSPITNIVVVMMENRTYDHYLGARKLVEGRPGDGLVAGMGQMDNAGTFHEIYRESVDCVADPPHDWTASRVQFGGGQNDGFLKAYQDKHGDDVPPYVCGYFGREDLPVTYALADQYTTCDRWFASVMGPTFPNRWYLHSAQSGGYMYNEFDPKPHWPTIYDRLTAAGVSWGYYYYDLPFLALMGVDPSKFYTFDQFLCVDAPMGKLPQVTFVDPGFAYNDDHPPHHPLLGQEFIGAVYTALAKSKQWDNSLMVVTYDEHGGFFDHVPPPTAPDERAADGFNQLGFRVPTIILGPYAKKNYVSSVVHDHTSVLKHIENMFGLAPLTMRDAAANDLSDAIDMDRLAAGVPDAPITLPTVTVDTSTFDPLCLMSDFKPSDIELAADRGVIPPELDRRAHAQAMGQKIRTYLAKQAITDLCE
jgi:phospholipase C